MQDFLNICKKFDTAFIQYRDKINPKDIQKQNLDFLKQNSDIPIIINDKLELLEYADGLHLGQEDIIELQKSLGIDDIFKLFEHLRKNYPNKIFGISTHNIEEIEIANRLSLDYIGLGAYKNTLTKDVSNILGKAISDIAKHSKHPVGAIGGVKVSDDIPNITYNVVGSNLYEY